MQVEILREPERQRPELTPEQRAAYEALIVEARSNRPDLAFALTKFPDVLDDLIYEIHDEIRLGNRVSQAEIFAPDFNTIPMPIDQFIADRQMVGDWYVENLFDCWRSEIVHVIEKGILEWVLTGSIGAGKCLNSDSIVNTTDGFFKIKDLYGKKPTVQAETGMRRVVSTHDEGMTKTLLVVTKHGHTIEGRADHRLRVVGEDFELAWKKLSQLRAGDVVLQAPAVSFGKKAIGTKMAELLGWFIAEGVRSEEKKASHNTAFFHLHQDEIDYVYRLARSANAGWAVDRNRACSYVRVFGGPTRQLFPPERSHEKEVPTSVLQAPREDVCAFLRGLFSGDGHVSNRECTLCTVSPKLAEQVRVLLTSLGIYCSVAKSVASYRKGGERHVTGDKYTVRIVGPDSLRRFEREIGFAFGFKKRALEESARRWFSNSDHSFTFRLTRKQYVELLSSQPSYTKANCPPGMAKTRTPRGLVHRLATQGCTVRLLREIVAAGGVLPPVLMGLANGTYLFDTVAAVTQSRAHCFDLSVDRDPSYVAEGFISHNTSAAMLAQEYKLYVVTCMRNPCSSYTATSITFGMYSAMRYLAYDVGANMLITRLKESPYFRDVVGISEEEDDPKKTKVKIFNFPNNVRFLFGSSHYHGMGQDVFGCIMDEVAFFEGEGAKKARALYSSIRSRIASRFKSQAGLTPGIMCLCSSANYEGDFLDEHIKNSAIQDRIHVSRFALYDVKKYIGPKFRVMVGDRVASSKLIDRVVKKADGTVDVIQVIPDTDLPEGVLEAPRDVRPHVEHVPVDFFTDYDDDMEQSLKDISGIAMSADSVLFPTMEKVDLSYNVTNPIVTARKHPFTEPSVRLAVSGLEAGNRLEDVFKVEDLFVEVDRFRRIYKMRVDPNRPRFIHVDLAETQCSAGIACVHLKGFRVVTQTDLRTGNKSEIHMPVIYIDFVMRIDPPKDMSEIDFEKIIAFIFYLRDLGMPLGGVSFDQYQSHHAQQIFEKAQVPVEEVSVDRSSAPYFYLKEIYNHLCMDGYEYPALRDELFKLRRKFMSNRILIVKPDSPGASKDVSDALCGSVYNLAKSKYLEEVSREAPMMFGRVDAAEQVQSEGGAVAVRKQRPRLATGLGDIDWVLAGSPGADKITGIY